MPIPDRPERRTARDMSRRPVRCLRKIVIFAEKEEDLQMDRRTKRIIRISAVSAGSVLLLLLVGTAIVLNFVFTPSKLTAHHYPSTRFHYHS